MGFRDELVDGKEYEWASNEDLERFAERLVDNFKEFDICPDDEVKLVIQLSMRLSSICAQNYSVTDLSGVKQPWWFVATHIRDGIDLILKNKEYCF